MNHATRLLVVDASDGSTLGDQSKIASDDDDVERRSWSADTAGGRRSISGSEPGEPVALYHISRLAPLGQALLIHGNSLPALVRGREWSKDLADGGAPCSVEAAEGRAA